jgi:hypothetical protein
VRRDDVRRQHLDRELPFEVQVAHQKHNRESTGTEPPFDRIAFAERRLQAGPQGIELGRRWCWRQLGQNAGG